ncbi:MAG: AAC(3) family N-acetyltransferase [Armatimonadetes bacterium]|nr:AAC(3) family N-acetyltransferase [Armatimonadota bacterium]
MANQGQVTAAELRDGLAAVGLTAGEVVFVHSSLSAFGHVVGGADTVIDALLATLGPEGTLVMPTFTWNAFHAAQRVEFDLVKTPCETGRIPETFRQRPGVQRSLHLCHSVAALGPQSEAVMGDGIHPFARGGSFDALYRLGAWNLMLGTGFGCCTALHAAEELERVPYRAYRHYPGSIVILPDGSRVASKACEFLRRDSSVNDFAKFEGVLAADGLLRTVQVGEATLHNARIRDVIDVARRLLAEDVTALSRPTGG